jgi:hypothetical protein
MRRAVPCHKRDLRASERHPIHMGEAIRRIDVHHAARLPIGQLAEAAATDYAEVHPVLLRLPSDL